MISLVKGLSCSEEQDPGHTRTLEVEYESEKCNTDEYLVSTHVISTLRVKDPENTASNIDLHDIFKFKKYQRSDFVLAH